VLPILAALVLAQTPPAFVTTPGTYQLHGTRVMVAADTYSVMRPTRGGETGLRSRPGELKGAAGWFIFVPSADAAWIFNGVELLRVAFKGSVADVASSTETPAVVGTAPQEVIDRLPPAFLRKFGGR
jgi:hypothetical protein